MHEVSSLTGYKLEIFNINRLGAILALGGKAVVTCLIDLAILDLKVSCQLDLLR